MPDILSTLKMEPSALVRINEELPEIKVAASV
jgi:hypothetical protein